MIRTATPVLKRPRPVRPPFVRKGPLPPPTEIRPAYDLPFWLSYASNGLLMVGVALLYRYADFVTLLGGSEFHLGWIVGIGMFGSIFMRLALGAWIDRFGARWLWLSSSALFVVTCWAHLAVSSYTGVAIYALRICYGCAIAGIYGASISFITSRGPSERMAELVAMLGTAGFLGCVGGAVLGDVLFGSVAVGHSQVAQMFILAGLLGLASMPFAWAASRREPKPAPNSGPPMFQVLRQCYSGKVLLVGVAMGVGLNLPNTFLRTYAAELSIPRIGLFFSIYAVAAVITRIATRTWFARFGTRPMIVLGLAILAASQLLFLLVHREWQLLFPAIGYGSAHAIVFPAIVAAGSVLFPQKNRGLATVLILAAWDLGQLVGTPLAGALLRYSEWCGLPAYPTMFAAMAGLLAAASAWYLTAK